MAMKKKFDAIKFVREQRIRLEKEWEKDPEAFWAKVRAQGDAWRSEKAAKKTKKKAA